MDTKTENKAVKMLATGKPQSEIAETLGVSQSTISRLKENKKEVIEKEIEKFIKSLPDITEQMLEDIRTTGKISKVLSGELSEETLPKILLENPGLLGRFMELSYKKQSDMLRALGVYPSNQPSVFVQNIFQSGSNVVISPNVLQILGKHLAKSLADDEEIIEAEVIPS